MEVGNEISSKIRSAIKAKLVELGAYLDDELPDYIMVMVANKKSQHQMASDLGLFLNENTEKFTTWLHGLLQKLQSITSESASISGKDKLPVDKSKLREKPVSSDGLNKHKKHAEKQDVGDLKSKKREDGLEDKKDRKKRKSDHEKKLPKPLDEHEATLLKDETDKPHRPNPESEDAPIGVPVIQEKPPSLAIDLLENEKEEAIAVKLAQADKNTVEQVLNTEIQPITSSEVIEPSSKIISSARPIDLSAIQVEEDDDFAQLLLTENDELAEELEQETALLASKKTESNSATVLRASDDEDSVEPKTKRGTASIIISSDSSKDGSPFRSSHPKSRPMHSRSPVRQPGRCSAVVRAVEPRLSEMSSRKRRGPVSVVGSISHSTESDDEGGYDPRNPAVGNVASVVKVTARKSSIPPKLQANKSLLLKAMTEAQKSVETRRRVAITPIRPFMRSEGRERERSERDRDHDRSSRSSLSSSSSREAKRHSPTPRLAQTSLRQAVSQPRAIQKSDPPVYIPTRKVQPAPRLESRDRVGIVSKSRRLEAEERAWRDKDDVMAPPRKFIKQEKGAHIVNFIIEREYDANASDPQPEPQPEAPLVNIKQEPVSPRHSDQSPLLGLSSAKQPRKNPPAAEIDSRVVEYEPEMIASPAEKSHSESGSQGVPVLLEDMESEEFVLDEDVLELTESASGLFEEDLRHSLIKEKPKDKTRFVVTLDGVDTDQYAMEIGEVEQTGEDVVMDEGQSQKMDQGSAGSGSYLLPQAKTTPAVVISPPKIQPLNINLKDSDEEGEAMEMETSPLTKTKMMERCKFWPACVNGAACDYHHPTVQCKTFPMCKFGDKCLYIHPNCRFDSKCSRPDCPYTHSTRRSIPPFQAPYVKPAYVRAAYCPPPPPSQLAQRGANAPQCKYFPACSNMSCPFFHPKPCRFGVSCKNKGKGCTFYHPPLPTMDKLTWVASKHPQSSAIDAVSDAKKQVNITA